MVAGASSEDQKCAVPACEAEEHVGEVDLEKFGDLSGSGRAAAAVGELSDGIIDSERKILSAAGDVGDPSGVTEMVFELTKDCRYRERLKWHAAAGIESIECAEQRHARYLDEILERLVRIVVAARETPRERHEPFKQRFARA